MSKRVDLGPAGSPEEHGAVQYTDDHGEWRSVPGFPPTLLIVSSLGFVRSKNTRGNELSAPFIGSLAPNGYLKTRVKGTTYYVHHFVCRAFCGPRRPDTTADHITKYDGDWKRERSDNRALNLRWATWSEQQLNKKKRLPTTCMRKPAVPAESQRNLQDEEWRKVNNRLYVSNMGRAQQRTSRGTAWGHKYTPKPCTGMVYANIQGAQKFHTVAFCAFGGVLLPGQTVDHIDQDTTNNKLSNLRAATHSEQNLNQTRTLGPGSNVQRKTALEGRPVDCTDGHWERFDSQKGAATILTKRMERPFQQSAIGKVMRGKIQQTAGWVFRNAA